MTLSAVRLAMMESLATISGVTVPEDPLPKVIDDKTIIVFPGLQTTTILSKARDRGIAISSDGTMQVEYHRRVPYEHLGSTMGDITSMIDTITELIWGELAGGGFSGTVHNIRGVALAHFGALGWNEWTFGARIMVSFTYLTTIPS